jgi:hypothetical protein
MKYAKEEKNLWDELPINPALKLDASAGKLPEIPDHPYDKKAFILSKAVRKPIVNYDDMVIPSVANDMKKRAGKFFQN